MITKLEKVVWQTSNGVEFDSEEAAIKYEKISTLVAQMEDSAIYWRETCADEVAEWLLENYDITPKKREA